MKKMLFAIGLIAFSFIFAINGFAGTVGNPYSPGVDKVTAIQRDVSTIKTDVNTLNSNVTAIQGDVSTIKTDVDNIKSTLGTPIKMETYSDSFEAIYYPHEKTVTRDYDQIRHVSLTIAYCGYHGDASGRNGHINIRANFNGTLRPLWNCFGPLGEDTKTIEFDTDFWEIEAKPTENDMPIFIDFNETSTFK